MPINIVDISQNATILNNKHSNKDVTGNTMQDRSWLLGAMGGVTHSAVGHDVLLDNKLYQVHRENKALVVTNEDPL